MRPLPHPALPLQLRVLLIHMIRPFRLLLGLCLLIRARAIILLTPATVAGCTPPCLNPWPLDSPAAPEGSSSAARTELQVRVEVVDREMWRVHSSG
jgi:hypothetical protein